MVLLANVRLLGVANVRIWGCQMSSWQMTHNLRRDPKICRIFYVLIHTQDKLLRSIWNELSSISKLTYLILFARWQQMNMNSTITIGKSSIIKQIMTEVALHRAYIQEIQETIIFDEHAHHLWRAVRSDCARIIRFYLPRLMPVPPEPWKTSFLFGCCVHLICSS